MVDSFGACGTPHLYWLTPTYPGLWVVDWCHFQWGIVSLSNCTIIGPAGYNTVCTDWTVFAPRLKQKHLCGCLDTCIWSVMHVILY